MDEVSPSPYSSRGQFRKCRQKLPFGLHSLQLSVAPNRGACLSILKEYDVTGAAKNQAVEDCVKLLHGGQVLGQIGGQIVKT